MKAFLHNMFAHASSLNRRNILAILEKNPRASLLDLGCDDGSFTQKLAARIGTTTVSGVEIVPEQAEVARQHGMTVKSFDINQSFSWPDEHFDVVHANQVIEHLYDADTFLAEIWRVLRPHGYTILSTENASSWCNIAASVMGWQMFSLTNISTQKRGIGNPLAIHRDQEAPLPSWNHVRIYAIRGLVELVEAHRFRVEKVRGAGYFPLPASLGDLDRTHAHFITLKARKR